MTSSRFVEATAEINYYGQLTYTQQTIHPEMLKIYEVDVLQGVQLSEFHATIEQMALKIHPLNEYKLPLTFLSYALPPLRSAYSCPPLSRSDVETRKAQ